MYRHPDHCGALISIHILGTYVSVPERMWLVSDDNANPLLHHHLCEDIVSILTYVYKLALRTLIIVGYVAA